jgi:maleylpyruvate isomerase
VVNSERYQLDLSPYPTITRIYRNCMQLDAFAAAHPSNQPDRDD